MQTTVQETISSWVTGESSRRLEEAGGFELWRLGRDRFDEFNRFVYRVYSEAFAVNGQVPFSFDDVVQASEQYFDQARLCAVCHPDGTIFGTWGLVVKTREDSAPLPIQNLFSIATEEIVAAMQAPDTRFLFNGWRTAVDKHALEAHGLAANRSVFVFDLLIRGLTEDFPQPEQFLGVAEMELIVLRYHRRIGIPWKTLGQPRHYWGRDRYPCAFRLTEFRDSLRVHHPERYRFIYERSDGVTA